MEERTVLLIKPDGVRRRLTNEIISRIQMTGLTVVFSETIIATENMVDKHYPKDKHWLQRLGRKVIKRFRAEGLDVAKALGSDNALEIGKMIRSWQIVFLSSGPMVKMLIQGDQAIARLRDIVGSTDPIAAKKGTIRGDLSRDDLISAALEKRGLCNVVHASENPEEAKNELKSLVFPIKKGK